LCCRSDSDIIKRSIAFPKESIGNHQSPDRNTNNSQKSNSPTRYLQNRQRPTNLALFSTSSDTMTESSSLSSSSSSSTPVSSYFSRASPNGSKAKESPPENDSEETYTVDSLRRYAEQLIAGNKNSDDESERESHKICVYLAGGGSTAVSTLAATPGASAFLLEGRTTYDRHSFLSACGIPDKATEGRSFSYGGIKAAGLAAKAALKQAQELAALDDDLRTMPRTLGIGCASVLVSNPTGHESGGTNFGRGTVVAVYADGRILTLGIAMKKPRSRFDEELVLSHLILRAAELAANPCEGTNQEYETRSGDWITEQWSGSTDLSCLEMDAMVSADADADTNAFTVPGESQSLEAVVEEAARRVVDGGEDAVLLLPLYNKEGPPIGIRPMASTVIPNGCIVFPGSFNPPHIGHLSLGKASIRTLERLEPYVHPRRYNEKPIVFEISLTNADKPSIDPKIVAERVQKFLDLASSSKDDASSSFPQQWGIVLTRAPLFEEKLRILRSCVKTTQEPPRVNFVIGTDTLVRILNPKYYEDQSPDRMAESLLELNRSGAGFIVGGRLEQGTTSEPKFVSGKEELVGLPGPVASMFAIMDESEFRVDLSSSQLRAQQAREQE